MRNEPCQIATCVCVCVCVWRNWRIVNELWFHNGHTACTADLPLPLPPSKCLTNAAHSRWKTRQSCALYQLLQFEGVAPRGVLRLRLTLQLVCLSRSRKNPNKQQKRQEQKRRKEAAKSAKIETRQRNSKRTLPRGQVHNECWMPYRSLLNKEAAIEVKLPCKLISHRISDQKWFSGESCACHKVKTCHKQRGQS